MCSCDCHGALTVTGEIRWQYGTSVGEMSEAAMPMHDAPLRWDAKAGVRALVLLSERMQGVLVKFLGKG
jgi:hypothetical protein